MKYIECEFNSSYELLKVVLGVEENMKDYWQKAFKVLKIFENKRKGKNFESDDEIAKSYRTFRWSQSKKLAKETECLHFETLNTV